MSPKMARARMRRSARNTAVPTVDPSRSCTRNDEAGRRAARDACPACRSKLRAAPECSNSAHCVFDRLDRARAHTLAGRLGLEDHRLTGERVLALALLGGGLLDDAEL